MLQTLAYFGGQRVELLQPMLNTVAELRARGEREWLVNASVTLANTYMTLGQRDLALPAYQEALDIGRQLGRLDFEGAALQNIGVLWYISDRDTTQGRGFSLHWYDERGEA